MTWNKKDKSYELTHGRIIKRFALFPIRIKNRYVWFEICYIHQIHYGNWYDEWWENINFVSKKRYYRYKKDRELYYNKKNKEV